ncbi:MAG: uracil phosphoribosyltransferase [Spirochaetes bacterium]|nr:uracil phosphoribosyltransferase [Spirochaetota bacterium]
MKMENFNFLLKDEKFDNLYIVNHPLMKHLLTHLRDKNTKPALFRTITKKITTLLSIFASYELSLQKSIRETPLESFEGYIINEQIVAIPILRAGLGMIDPICDLFPEVSVGYVGIQRDHETAIPHEYYYKLPDIKNKVVFLLDPMLATGGSASYAINLIKSEKPKKIIMLAIVSAPEGVSLINKNHPEVQIFTASLDRELNFKKYILPGLGDMGDRLYGTI